MKTDFDFEEVKRRWLDDEQPCERKDGRPVIITAIQPHPEWGHFKEIVGLVWVNNRLIESYFNSQTGACFHGSGCDACNLVVKPAVVPA